MRMLPITVLLLAVAFTPEPAGAQPEGACRSDVPTTQEYAAWAGPWAKHGATLSLRADGCGMLSWRTYEPCRFGAYDGFCDPVVNGTPGEGGRAMFVLSVLVGKDASGRMLARSAATDPVDFGIVLHAQDDGTLGVEWDGQGQTFCRTWDWRPRCGA